jgi:hypothetical protein
MIGNAPSAFDPAAGGWRHIATRYDAAHGALWVFLRPGHRACFSFELLEDPDALPGGVEALAETRRGEGAVRYVSSRLPPPRVPLGGARRISMFSRC